jgi:hypothetical protein
MESTLLMNARRKTSSFHSSNHAASSPSLFQGAMGRLLISLGTVAAEEPL